MAEEVWNKVLAAEEVWNKVVVLRRCGKGLRRLRLRRWVATAELWNKFNVVTNE